MSFGRIEQTTHFLPTQTQLAASFSHGDASDQAAFIVAVANIFASWGALARDTQLMAIAKELRENHGAAEFVRFLLEEIEQVAQ